MVRMVNFMFFILCEIKKVLLGATLEKRRKKKKKTPNIVKYLRGKDYPSVRMTEV